MKSIKSAFLISTLYILIGCSASFGEKYTLGNLEIYYNSSNILDSRVIALGEYFRKNELILDHPHSIQLTTDETTFILKVVVANPQVPITEEERYNFTLLEEDLKREVFNGMNLKIEFCNENFVVIDQL